MKGPAFWCWRRDEGAEKRGAPILCTLAGYGASADAYHVTQPDPEGAGAVIAIRNALADAGVEPDEVDYINAHGTSTPYNDRVETIAIKSAFGNEAKKIAVSSTKSQMGHLLGAAGAVEAAICALAIIAGIAPGTTNYEDSRPRLRPRLRDRGSAQARHRCCCVQLVWVRRTERSPCVHRPREVSSMITGQTIVVDGGTSLPVS